MAHKISLKSVRVSTSSYTLTHGKKPSGYGTWSFKIAGRLYITCGCMYSEAKRWAVKNAQSVGSYEVAVCG